MTKHLISQSQKRYSESLGSLFGAKASKKLIFLKSSSDEGVILNGGRNGAKFAPQSFLSVFKKFTSDEIRKNYSFIETEMASVEEERADFKQAQLKQSERINQLLEKHPESTVCHLGGGHDHIFPLLLALGKQWQKIIVINVDAHADTRTDETYHSGTPFRQFAKSFKGDFHLFQIGLHLYANSSSTLTPLEQGQMSILWRNEVDNEKRREAFFTNINQLIDPKTLVVFSLDADALSGTEVPGVSAVNGDGLSRKNLLQIWDGYRTLKKNHESVLGIYELNPVFDSLNLLSMKTVASFVFEILD